MLINTKKLILILYMERDKTINVFYIDMYKNIDFYSIICTYRVVHNIFCFLRNNNIQLSRFRYINCSL